MEEDSTEVGLAICEEYERRMHENVESLYIAKQKKIEMSKSLDIAKR
jgi:hypothetical protein